MTGNGNEAELKIDMGGDAAEEMKKLAKETDKAADAQDRLQRRTERTNRVFSGLARQRVQEERRAERERQQQARQEERRTERKRQEAARRYNQSDAGIADRRMARIEQEKRVQARMEAMGYGPTKRRELTDMQTAGQRILAAEKEERIQRQVERLTTRTGMEKVMGLKAGEGKGMMQQFGSYLGVGSKAAMILTAAKYGVDTAATADRQLQHGSPYADDFTRGREFVHNAPFGREVMSGIDLASGRSERVSVENQRRMEGDLRARHEGQSYQAIAEQRRQERVAELNARSVRRYATPGISDTRRGTLQEEQQYRLAQKLLPLEERRTEAARAAAEAENERTVAVKQLQEQEQRLSALRGQKGYIEGKSRSQAAAAGQRKTVFDSDAGAPGTPEYLRSLGDLRRVNQQIEDAEQQRLATLRRVQESGVGVAQARYQRAQADRGVSQARLADFREREQTATAQSARLMYAGPEGRARAMYAMQAANEYGLENLSPEMIASGDSLFHDTFRKMAEKEGQRLFPEFHREAPLEYRDTVPGSRRQVDTAQEADRTAADETAVAYKDAMLEALRKIGPEDGTEFGTEFKGAFKRMLAGALLEMKVEGTLGGYDLPR